MNIFNVNMSETLRSHRWNIQQLGPISQNDTILVKELQLPQYTIERQEVLGGMQWYKYAKSVKWEDLEVQFYDNSQIYKSLLSWRDKVFTNDGGIQSHNISSGYKKDCIFALLDGEGSVAQKIKLKNAWPASINLGRLSYTNNEIKLVVLTLAYDWAESEIPIPNLDS
jgi:hypothetical protein